MNYIKEHGFNVRLKKVEKEAGYFVEVMEAEEVYANSKGITETKWVKLAPDYNEVRDWLGY